MLSFPRQGPGGMLASHVDARYGDDREKGQTPVIPSTGEQERTAMVIPFPQARRDARLDRDRDAVEAGDEDRIAADRAESIRQHPSNGGPR